MQTPLKDKWKIANFSCHLTQCLTVGWSEEQPEFPKSLDVL